MRSASRIGPMIVVIGGCTAIREEGTLKSIEILQTSPQLDDDRSVLQMKKLRKTLEMEIPRRAPTAIPIANQQPAFAVIGGCSAPMKHLSSIEIVDLGDEKNNETSKCDSPSINRHLFSSSLPEHSCAASCSIRTNTSVIVGGFDGVDALKSVSIIGINEKGEPIVKRLIDFCSPLKNASMFSINERVVLIMGGWDGSRTLQTIFKLHFTDSLDSYEWEMSGLLPYPIEGHSTSKWQDSAFISGGFDGISVVDHILRLNLVDNSIEILPTKLRIPRENHTTQIIGDFLLVIGGWDGRKALDSIEVFSISSDPPYLKEISSSLHLDVPRNRPTSIMISAQYSDDRVKYGFFLSIYLFILMESDVRRDLNIVLHQREEQIHDQPIQSASTSAPNEQVLLVELTSLDELSFPTNSNRRIKYTCVSVSKRFLIVGTCTGTVYVFSRYASRHRSKLTSLPVSVFTTRDGSVNKLLISPQETHVSVGSESGRVSVASLTSQNSSDLPSNTAIIYTAPGDVRRMDRVTSLCWSPQGESLFVGHFSGRLIHHRIGSKSVFRASHEQLHHFDAQIVQVCHSNEQLLVSTSSFSYLVSLETKQPIQIGRKVRNEAMGACFCGEVNEGKDQSSSYIVAARPKGRLWEANLAATVYRTHQFREQTNVSLYPAISYRSPVCLDQNGSSEQIKELIDFQRLDPLIFEGHQFVASIVDDRCVIADLEGCVDDEREEIKEGPSLRLLTNFGTEIVDYSWSGTDLFVLYSGEGRLRKFTLLPISKAVEKLALKKAYKQAAKLLLEMKSPLNVEVVDQYREVIEALQQATHRSTEADALLRSLQKRLGDSQSKIDRRSSITANQSISPRVSPPKMQKFEPKSQSRVSSRLPASVAAILSRYSMNGPLKSLNVGIHKVYPAGQGNHFDDDNKTRLDVNRDQNQQDEKKGQRERSKSSSPSPVNRKTSRLNDDKWMSEDETRSDRIPLLNQHILKAKTLLQSRELSTTDPEEVNSLRTLLGLDPSEKPLECVQFIPTVTLASAPRSLAKLAQTVPLDIVNAIKVERRTTRFTNHPSKGSRESLSSGGSSSISTTSPLSKGPRILKTVRPNRGGISVQSTKMPRKVEVRTSIINTENLDNRFDVTTSLQGTKGNVGKIEENVALLEISKSKTEKIPFQTCDKCSLHRSWLAVAVIIPCSGRAHLIDGHSKKLSPIPTTSLQWMTLLGDRLKGKSSIDYPNLRPCSSCLATINRLSTIFDVPPKKECRPTEIERVRRRALAMSDEHIGEIFFGETRQPNRDQLEKTSMTTKNGRSDELKEIESRSLRPNLHVFLEGVSNSLLLAISACCLGVEELCETMMKSDWKGENGEKFVEMLTTNEWSMLTSIHHFLLSKKANGPLMSLQSLKAILREHHFADFIQLDQPGLEKEKSQEKPVSTLPPRRPPVSSKPVIVKSWIADMTRNCLLCTLSLRTVVGGTDCGVVAYYCGHSFHVVCAQGISSNPPSPPASSIAPNISSTVPSTCIACRIRSRNTMNSLTKK
ncbi:unnamed protein product, partial [Mesorhabditis belari]|uniref:RING-type domain-containing protein n=1 Tax=Mesorhabditis belari TaxID=2138241 RepID=A0AAF3EDI0_9BILA